MEMHELFEAIDSKVDEILELAKKALPSVPEHHWETWRLSSAKFNTNMVGYGEVIDIESWTVRGNEGSPGVNPVGNFEAGDLFKMLFSFYQGETGPVICFSDPDEYLLFHVEFTFQTLMNDRFTQGLIMESTTGVQKKFKGDASFSAMVKEAWKEANDQKE
jgi:hypothetical protein